MEKGFKSFWFLLRANAWRKEIKKLPVLSRALDVHGSRETQRNGGAAGSQRDAHSLTRIENCMKISKTYVDKE